MLINTITATTAPNYDNDDDVWLMLCRRCSVKMDCSFMAQKAITTRISHLRTHLFFTVIFRAKILLRTHFQVENMVHRHLRTYLRPLHEWLDYEVSYFDFMMAAVSLLLYLVSLCGCFADESRMSEELFARKQKNEWRMLLTTILWITWIWIYF